MKINVTIDKLVLYGFEQNYDRKKLGSAIENELKQLFRQNNLPSLTNQHKSIYEIAGGSLTTTTTNSNPTMIGGKIARSLYNSCMSHLQE
jgi:hypothetical protein